MKQTPLRRISKKRLRTRRAEIPVRRQLIERAHGVCEWCGLPPGWLGLSPHEKNFRSHGGKLSLDNSVMLCDTCGKTKGHNLRVGTSDRG